MGSLGLFRVSLDSFGVVELNRVRPEGRWVRRSGAPGIWDRSGAPWGSLCSFWVVGFVRMQRGGRWVHLEKLGSFGCNLRVAGFIRVRWVHSCSPWESVASFGVGSFGYALGVVEFIGVRWVHLLTHWLSLGSFGVVGFVRVRPGGRYVHSRLLGSFGCALVVV